MQTNISKMLVLILIGFGLVTAGYLSFGNGVALAITGVSRVSEPVRPPKVKPSEPIKPPKPTRPPVSWPIR